MKISEFFAFPSLVTRIVHVLQNVSAAAG